MAAAKNERRSLTSLIENVLEEYLRERGYLKASPPARGSESAMDADQAASAIISVGKGRGFIVESSDDKRYVITAAHCLPFFPPCMGASFSEERTYRDLLKRLVSRGRRAPAECVFADPVADVAVLGEPDGQAFPQGADAYRAVVEHEDVTPLAIAATANETKARLFSLKREWMACQIKSVEQAAPLWIFGVAGHIEGGMSGSPIVAASQGCGGRCRLPLGRQGRHTTHGGRS